MALTPKQKIFADEYLIDLNATRAYKVAYPSCKKDEAAAVNGSKLLRNTKVAEYIQERMKDRERRTEITQDWVLEELRRIASANGTDLHMLCGSRLYGTTLTWWILIPVRCRQGMWFE